MSSALSQNEAHITVGRWSGTYHVPRDFPVPQTVQHRVDDIVASQLAASCSSYLKNYLSADNPEVWRIRNLTLNVSLDAEFSNTVGVVVDCARNFASELLSVLDSGESATVVRFPNQVAFLTQFLSDLATGRAWGKWYYEEFSELRVLSERQAICTIFLRPDTPSVELLLQLASIGRLESVLQRLNDADARLIFDLCFANVSSASRGISLQKWTGMVLELWNSAPLRAGSRQENRSRDSLRLFVRTVSRFPAGNGDPQLKAAIDGLLELRRVLSEIPSPVLLDSLIRTLAVGDCSAALDRIARSGVSDPVNALSFFAQTMQGDAVWGGQAAAVILGETHQRRFLTSTTISEGESLLSSFGGVFLLATSLEALQFAELARTAALPSDSPDRVAALLRHLIAAKCLGRNRFADASDDPAIRLFSGLEATPFRQSAEALNVSQLDLSAAHSILLQAILARDETHPPVLFADIVSFEQDGAALLLRDLARDEWLDLVPISSKSDLAAVVNTCVRRVCAFGGELFIADSLSSLQRNLDAAATPHVPNASMEEQLATRLGLTRAQLLLRLQSPQHHYSYFSLSGIWPDFELAPALDCFCTLISRAALRHFSRKLFGFESSSPHHLYQNFLAGLSELRRTGESLEVHLPVSPLSMILRMAGLHEQKFSPSWLKGMEVWLLPPQE